MRAKIYQMAMNYRRGAGVCVLYTQYIHYIHKPGGRFLVVNNRFANHVAFLSLCSTQCYPSEALCDGAHKEPGVASKPISTSAVVGHIACSLEDICGQRLLIGFIKYPVMRGPRMNEAVCPGAISRVLTTSRWLIA